MKNFQLLTACAVFALASGCGSKFEKDDTANDGYVEDHAPADSTGASGSVGLGFSSVNTASLLLNADDAASTVKIGDAIELSYAKFSIAKIKIKTNKERTEQESALEAEENKSELANVEQLDSEVGEVEGAELAKPDGAGDKVSDDHAAKKDDRLAKMKAKLDSIKTREKDQLEKEAKKDKATKFVGPYIYDAITGNLEGAAPQVDLADGSYNRVEFQLKRNFSVSEDSPLLGNVFVIKGTILKDGTVVPFEIDWHVAINFRLTAESSFVVTAGADNILGIDFDMSKWFTGVDLATATVDSDGTIYIDKSSNKEILKQIRKNIKLGSGFGKDKNGDGKLEDSERSGKGQDTDDAE